MSKAIFTNSILVVRKTGWTAIFAASLSTNTAGDVPYAKRSSTSGSNASHTIDQSDYRMFLIQIPSRLTTTMSQDRGPSTWSAGGYIKETQPTKSVGSVTMQNNIPQRQTLPKMVRSNNMHHHWRSRRLRRSHYYHRPSTMMRSNNMHRHHRLLRPNNVHRGPALIHSTNLLP